MPTAKHTQLSYSPLQRQRIRNMIVALQAAREMVKSGDFYFTCFALDQWSWKHSAAWTRQAHTDAKSLVVRSIAPYGVFDGKVEQMNPGLQRPSKERFRALRLRWLNQLIADCEKAIS